MVILKCVEKDAKNCVFNSTVSFIPRIGEAFEIKGLTARIIDVRYIISEGTTSLI